MSSEPDIVNGTARLYRNMPFDEYTAIPAINASALKGVGRLSPAHLRSYLNGEIERSDTDDMRFGRAMHCAAIEPDELAARFPVTSLCCGVKKDGRQCLVAGSYLRDGNWYCGTHKGEWYTEPSDYLTPDEARRITTLIERLKQSPVNEYLARPGLSEVVIVWEWSGFTLKTRIDRLAVEPSRITIIDLKKCRVGRATDDLMRKECFERGYDIQAAINSWGVRAIYGDVPVPQFYLLFIEDNYPFGSNVLMAEQYEIEFALKDISNQLSRYRACEKSGQFYSYINVLDKPHCGILPTWEAKKLLKGEG